MIYFIVNPAAGNGKSLKAANQIEQMLKHKRVAHKIILTQYPYHAQEIAAGLIENGAKTIVAVGGDGTVLETARGFYNKTGKSFYDNVYLGIIPVGSGNDLVKSTNIPTEVEKALAIILAGKSMSCDMIECNGELALNIACIGIDAEIAEWAQGIKKLFGKFSYAVSVMKNIFTYKSVWAKIMVDGRVIEGKFMLMAVANGSCYGGGFKITPMASLDDGYLTLAYVDDLPLHKILALFPKIPYGGHVNHEAVHFINCTDVEIYYDKSYAFNIDGNILKTDGHICFSIHPNAIHILHK